MLRAAMKGSLARRLVWRIGVPVALLFGLAAWFGAMRSFQRVVADTTEHTRLLARFRAEKIEESMNGWKELPWTMAPTIEEDCFKTEEALEKWLRSLVWHNSDVHGSCIAFEPDAFTPGKRDYAPYWHWVGKELEFVQVGNPTYDYFKWDWYRIPKQTGRSMWTEPFFDEGGGDVMMTTYCVPFTRAGVFRGVATVDIALTQLVKEMKQEAASGEGYSMLVSRGGKILVCPDDSKVMKTTIQDLHAELGRRMTAGEEGLMRTREPFGGRPAFVAYAPIMRGAFSLAVAIPESEAMGGAWELVAELVAIGVIGVAGMLAGLWFVARSIVRPIENLAGAARAVAAGDLAQKLDPGAATDEVRDLTTAFSRMTEKLRTHIEELRHSTAEKEWIAGELNAARTMQMAMVPRKFPAFPERSEIDIHGFVLPAREVGGDFCNFFFVDDRRLALVVGDVAGKGVPAALFMAVTTTLLKAHAQPGRSPGEVVALTNRELYDEAVSGVFVTLVYALLDTATGELEFCNAGHHTPLIVKAGGAVRSLESGKDVACAIVGEWKFSTQRVWLTPGDTVVFYTDGVTEAMNGKNQLFTAERLEAELTRSAACTPFEIAQGIVEAVRQFAGGREQNDDIGVLVLRWVGRLETAEAGTLPAVPARVPQEVPVG